MTITMNVKDYGEITASEYLLNVISIWASESANWNKEHGYEPLSESYEEISNQIYKELKALGVYDKEVA